jgi:hypothetical protein
MLRLLSLLLLPVLLSAALGQAGEKGKSYRVGEVDHRGRLVIFVFKGNQKHDIPDTPFLLTEPYGTMLINEGDEKHPKARYVLANRAKKKVFSTFSEAEFKRALAQVPRGSKIRQYETCTVSLGYGLAPNTVERFANLQKDRGLKVGPEPIVTCICESIG